MTTLAVIGGCGYLGKQIVKLAVEGRGNFRDEDLEQDAFVKLQRFSNRMRDVRVVDICVSEDQDGSSEIINGVTVSYKRCDIRNKGALTQALSGCDVIIHSASIIDATDSENDLNQCFDVNVKGTDNVVNACIKLGIPYLIYTSSISAIGPNIDRKTLKNIDTHDQEYVINHPTYFVYGRSKREAEQIVQKAHGHKLDVTGSNGQTKLSTSIIRPGAMFGEEDAYFTRHVEMGNSSCFRTILTVGNVIMTFAYVGNVAYLHLLAAEYLLTNKPVDNCIVLYAGDDCVPDNISKIQAYILCPLGFRVLGAPIGVFIFISHIIEALHKLETCLFGSTCLLGLRKKAGAAVVHSASTDVSFSYNKAHTLLGYNLIYSFENSIIRTQRWFLQFTENQT